MIQMHMLHKTLRGSLYYHDMKSEIQSDLILSRPIKLQYSYSVTLTFTEHGEHIERTTNIPAAELSCVSCMFLVWTGTLDLIMTRPQCSTGNIGNIGAPISPDLEDSPQCCDGKACHIKRQFGETSIRVTVLTHASRSSYKGNYLCSLLWIWTKILRHLDTRNWIFEYLTWTCEEEITFGKSTNISLLLRVFYWI